MRSSVFHYPFDKVVRTSKGALRNMGLKIVNFDKFRGHIEAVSSFSILNPPLHVDLKIEELPDHDIRVTVSGHSTRQHFLQRTRDDASSEAEILERVSLLL